MESWVRQEPGTVPQGRLRKSQDSSPGRIVSSRRVVSPLAIPGLASWDILSRPWRDCSSMSSLPRTSVLGYSQPSLRDSVCKSSSHADSFSPRGLFSSRPKFFRPGAPTPPSPPIPAEQERSKSARQRHPRSRSIALRSCGVPASLARSSGHHP